MIQYIDGNAFRRMMISAAASVENSKQLINELNVFPVPDGDTGTNMSLTLNNAVAELRKLPESSLSKTADTVASALLRGARGNSGVILSLLFRGFSKAWKGLELADGSNLAAALESGVDAAYGAIMHPTEGTILTVSRRSAEAARACLAESTDFEAAFEKALETAASSLAETMEINPVLKKAGVVDAGGKGYLCILEAMLSSLRGNDVVSEGTGSSAKEAADFSDFDTEDITYSYCTEFIVSRDNFKDPAVLHDYLSGIGDCLVQVNDEDIIKVHVHTNEPGNVITHALDYGALLTVKIENMREQHTQKIAGTEVKSEPEIAAAEKQYGIVAVCAGAGLAATFRDLGADRIVEGGQTMNPSTDDILKAVNATPAETVYVFPNNKNIVLAAEQCVPLSEKKVVVIHTKTVPQGITALLNFDSGLPEEVLTETLKNSFADVDTMQITYAARDSEFDGHVIAQGEYLGLYNGGLFRNGSELGDILKAMAIRIRESGKELVSVFFGEDVSEEDAAGTVLPIFEANCPDAEITLIDGGQPVYYYLISAE